MGFTGYRYRFDLFAAHSNVGISDQKDGGHYHNFTITLYINDINHINDDNFKLESTIKEWLDPLQRKHLSDTELFKGQGTTLENMAHIFYTHFAYIIQELGYDLVKLEIYENPIRVYSVSDQLLDSSVNVISNMTGVCIPLVYMGDDITEMEEVAVTQEDVEA